MGSQVPIQTWAHGAHAHIAVVHQVITDEGLDPEACPPSFDLRPSGPKGETASVVGTDAATLRDTRRFVIAFESHVAVMLLAVETRHIRIHLEQGPDHPDCMRDRNVPAIEPGEIAPRAPLHLQIHANIIVGRALVTGAE